MDDAREGKEEDCPGRSRQIPMILGACSSLIVRNERK
jgi:hypothetical protein